MKKHLIPVLALILCAFTLGFLLGRSQNRDPIYLSKLPTEAKHDFPPYDGTVPASKEYEVSFPIDLNTADIRQLTALPGIGEGLARRIIDYRAFCGPFSKPEELLNVEGIGEKTLESILDLVITGG